MTRPVDLEEHARRRSAARAGREAGESTRAIADRLGLGQRVEVEIILPSAPAAEALEALRSRRKDWLAEHPHYRNIRVFVEIAP